MQSRPFRRNGRIYRHLNYHYSGAGGLLEILDGFSSLADDEADFVAGDHHLKEARASAGHAVIHGTPDGQSAVVASLVGDDLGDGRFCGSEMHQGDKVDRATFPTEAAK